MNEHTIHVAPNATLSAAGLMIDGELGELRHFGDFKNFAFNTQAQVGTVLSILFPFAKATPNLDGSAVTATEEAWEHYSRHVASLVTEGEDSRKENGSVLLQWCVAAFFVAKATNHEVMDAEEFLPVAYLAYSGAQALSCTLDDWAEYLEWREWSATQAAVIARLNGTDRKDPRPKPVTVTVPWPELLGADIGGEEHAMENACRVAQDIIASETDAWLRVGAHHIQFHFGGHFIAEFERVAVGKEAEPHLTIQLNLSNLVAGVQARVQRDIWEPNQIRYCFRIFNTQMPRQLVFPDPLSQ